MDTFGVRPIKSWGRSIPASWISWLVNTVTAIGTFCMLSVRFRAVTTISSS